MLAFLGPEAPKSTPEGSQIDPGGSKIDPGGSEIDPGGSPNPPRIVPGDKVFLNSLHVPKNLRNFHAFLLFGCQKELF